MNIELHERAARLLRAARERSLRVSPDLDQVLRFYVSAARIFDRAAEHVVRHLEGVVK